MTTPFPFTSGQVLTAAEMNDITNLPINDQTANYTLVVGDAGKRVIMNAAGATTITVNTSVFTTGDTVFIANKGAGTCTITAGTATVNTSGSLALAQYGGGTLVFLSASVANFFPSGGIGYGTATGGTPTSISPGGVNYTLLTFTASGTLTVTKSGLFDVLLVGGGGGGGLHTSATGAGGGGGGGVIQQTIYLDANATVTVGAKGAAQTSAGVQGNRGTFSQCNQLCAGGGGGGGGDEAAARAAGSAGGERNTTAAITFISVGANNGGTGTFTSGSVSAGGGGGSTAVGANAGAGGGGNGGTGTDVSTFIGGSALFHGAGGGGNSRTTTGGTAGNSTGGNGGSSGAQGSNATGTNYGCGGGGGGLTQGGAGADGVVYVRYKS